MIKTTGTECKESPCNPKTPWDNLFKEINFENKLLNGDVSQWWSWISPSRYRKSWLWLILISKEAWSQESILCSRKAITWGQLSENVTRRGYDRWGPPGRNFSISLARLCELQCRLSQRYSWLRCRTNDLYIALLSERNYIESITLAHRYFCNAIRITLPWLRTWWLHQSLSYQHLKHSIQKSRWKCSVGKIPLCRKLQDDRTI